MRQEEPGQAMSDILTFEAIAADAGAAVGGKGFSLAELCRAGLPVPPGFCITAQAHRRLKGRSLGEDGLANAIVEAYRQLGGGLVAVRSSATAEDGSLASFAGQQETLLGIEGEAALLEAVARCWESLESERAVAYRRQQGVAEDAAAMAVVVQKLVPAEVAGVLFTRDPLDPTGKLMLVEASWGIGETVVSGQVTPDRFHLDRGSGAVQSRHINRKLVLRTQTETRAVPAEKQEAACLDGDQLVQLAELGRSVEQCYGEPRDIEWAFAEGRFWLLQARPITTADAAEREEVRREEIDKLRQLAEPGGTVWSRFNLAEVLPSPTPMTWSIVRRFMSGKGGYGGMYRDLGFKPHASLDEAGVFDLVCGRPYCNLSREPRLYSGGIPYEHPYQQIKADPSKALYPVAVQNPAKAGALYWLLLPLRLPFAFVGAIRFALRLNQLKKSFAERFRTEIQPAFLAAVEREQKEDLSKLTPAELVQRLEAWIQRALVEFARESLKPTALVALAGANLERFLRKALGVERARAAIGELTMGVHPDVVADFAGALKEVCAGRRERGVFLEQFGHRGPQEMELSQPRWAEDHAALDEILRQSAGVSAVAEKGEAEISVWERIAKEAKFAEWQKKGLEPEWQALKTYMALRETAKNSLMKGYALLRRILLELDRRHGLQGGIFYLQCDELSRLVAGENFAAVVARRKRRRQAALSLEVPQVIFSDDLEAIGRPVHLEGAESLKGVPLSAGVVEAPALVLTQPDPRAIPAEPYILVCPSTDPAWVPLFVKARGLVMETGGVLSHGAIVAREFGLPAVAGLPEITKLLKTGQRVRVDGGSGVVSLLEK